MFELGGISFNSRLLLGTARYPSMSCLADTIESSGTEIVTVSLRRAAPSITHQQDLYSLIRKKGLHILPNTAGCKTVKDAVTTAQMAREIYSTHWIKLEVIGCDETLQPDIFSLVEAARILSNEGFEVFPYTTEDLLVGEKLMSVGCKILMPWASPIGSGRGLMNKYLLRKYRQRLPEAKLIVDAGIGKPSDATQAMEIGYDGVLLNTAISQAQDPVGMGSAFAKAVDAGRLGYEAGLMEKRDFAVPSTPVVGTPFWHEEVCQ